MNVQMRAGAMVGITRKVFSDRRVYFLSGVVCSVAVVKEA